MSNRLSEEKANAIASEYLTNGFKKVKALLAIGYSKTYANNIGLKLFDNDRVKQAIDRINASVKANTSVTVQSIIKELDDLHVKADAKKDYSTVARCIELKGKTIAAFADKQVNIDDNEVKQLPKDVADAARARAKIRLLRPREA